MGALPSSIYFLSVSIHASTVSSGVQETSALPILANVLENEKQVRWHDAGVNE